MSNPVKWMNMALGNSSKWISPLLWASLFAGLIIHLAGFFIFEVQSNLLFSRKNSGAFIEYVPFHEVNGTDELEEQAILFDSAPLFIPTQWNAAQYLYAAWGWQMDIQFPQFEPEIDLVASLGSEHFPMASHVEVREPVNLLASSYWNFFESFGDSHESTFSFPDPQPFATVEQAGEGMLLELRPQLSGDDFSDLSDPVVYYLGMASPGYALGRPTLGKSSGNERFDRAVLNWLGRSSVLAQMPSGYLAITVYP